MVQSTVADPTLRAGQIYTSFWDADSISRAVEGASGLAAGHLVEWGTSPEQQVQEVQAVPVADPDAIATAAVVASAVAAQNIPASSFDGVIGRDRIAPARCLSISFDASADWNTPSGECRVNFYGDDDELIDSIAKPNGSGAGTYNTAVPASMVSRFHIEACNGAGGTATVGVATIGASTPVKLHLADYPGISEYEGIKEPGTSTREFAQYDDVSVLRRGDIGVPVEHAVSVGDPAYVRMVAGGGHLAGSITGSDGADTPATYARLVGAHFITSASADDVAVLRIGG